MYYSKYLSRYLGVRLDQLPRLLLSLPRDNPRGVSADPMVLSQYQKQYRYLIFAMHHQNILMITIENSYRYSFPSQPQRRSKPSNQSIFQRQTPITYNMRLISYFKSSSGSSADTSPTGHNCSHPHETRGPAPARTGPSGGSPARSTHTRPRAARPSSSRRTAVRPSRR